MNAGGSAITTPTTLAGALQLRDWTLDGVGNWAKNNTQSVGGSLLTANRTHTNFNEITNETGDIPSTSFDNDDNGNQITNSEFDFQWDALNRLRSVTRILDGALIASYSYDCQNRRMQKQTSNPQPSTTNYYYSGWRVCEEYDFNGTNETLKYQYVWGATYHDELIARDNRSGGTTIAQLNDGSGSDRQFQHHNTLFSVFAVTDETGAVLERYQYDPYGNQTVMDASFNVLTDSAIDQEFSYTGQRFDAETDLYYYKNRFYSSEQGRFISRDPIGYRDEINLYLYVNNSPTTYIDIHGLLKLKLPYFPGSGCVKAIKAYQDAVNYGKKICKHANQIEADLMNCIQDAIIYKNCCPPGGSSITAQLINACGNHCPQELSKHKLFAKACKDATIKVTLKVGAASKKCGSWLFKAIKKVLPGTL